MVVAVIILLPRHLRVIILRATRAMVTRAGNFHFFKNTRSLIGAGVLFVRCNILSVLIV